jgi:LysM repeat protein
MALALDPRFVVELSPHPQRRDLAAVYVRRRVAAGIAVVVALMLVLGGALAAERALAGRGGVPASAPTAQPVQAAPYIVQPDDTLWSIARRFHGEQSLTSYVEQLVQANGGAEIQIGQRIQLP